MLKQFNNTYEQAGIRFLKIHTNKSGTSLAVCPCEYVGLLSVVRNC